MMEENIEFKPYVVPKNVKSRFEIFNGFGMKELAMVLIGGLIGACLGLIIMFIVGSPLWLGLTVPGGALGFFIGKPDPRTGRNTFDLINDVRRFKGKPTRYYYRFGDGRGE
ncbi:PrgI family protein [Bacillus sp. FJAT-28004]|uniref:PrgI family protein n=1 Tax=Bacillus sp. FJAT-28004 TaxID=1679165 RepID=UPI0006B50BF6|nr:PrgI family protein [Bacillus sp. FJAT-28004]